MNTAPEKVLGKCPACSDQTLAYPHCEAKGCSWARCRNSACDLWMDVKAKRGHIIDPLKPGQRKNWGNWNPRLRSN